MTDLNDEYSNKSDASGGRGTISRIDGLLRQCIIATNSQDYSMWFTGLTNLYKEAYNYFKNNKDLKIEINYLKTEVEKEYSNYMSHINKFNNLKHNEKSRYGFSYNGNIYYLLENFEIQLRSVLFDANLLINIIPQQKEIIG